MRGESRATKAAFRRAVWASVALHALAAGAFLLLLRTGDGRKPLQADIDTHAADAPQVRMHLVDESPVSVEVPQPPAAGPTPVKPQATNAQGPPIAEAAAPRAAAVKGPPLAALPPRMLPPEVLALARRPALQPGPPLVNTSTAADPNVRPAGGTTAPAAGTSARPIHGTLNPEQTAVYVLDCSGSMGAAGKFDAARAALVATLAQQPPAVRFQVIVYAGSAGPLLASDRRGLPATAANVRAAAEKLASLEPRGRSSHLEAVRAALAFRPDVILILTDADDLTPAALRRVFAGEPKPVPVCVARVTAGRVEPPREVK